MRSTFKFLSILMAGALAWSAAGAPQVTVERLGQVRRVDTAQQALEAAQPGDTVVLGPGVHRGPLVIGVDRVRLRGEPGAVVNANAADWHPLWRHEPSIAANAYSSEIAFEPGVMSIDGRSMVRLEADRGAMVVHRDGVGRAGRNALGACFTYLHDSGRVVVSFAEGIDPADVHIEAAPEQSAVVCVTGGDDVTVEGLILTGGSSGVLLTDTAGSTVQRCLVYAADAGIHLGQGATRCRLLHNDVTWNPDALTIDVDRDSGLAADDVWMAHKRFGTYDKWGVLIDRAGADNEVAYNYVYNVFNGIQNEDGVGKNDVQEHFTRYVFQGKSPCNQGLVVHHNRIDLALDDALEPGNELVDNRWYANVVTRGRCATRFKTVTMGPFYFYDNVLLDCFDGLRLYKSSPESAEVMIYNNVVRHPSAIVYHKMNEVMWNDPWLSKQIGRGTAGFTLFNNVFLADTYFSNNGGDVRPNFRSDFNVFTANPDASLLLRGFDEHSRFHVDEAMLMFQGPAVSVASEVLGQRAAVDLGSLGINGAPPGWDEGDRSIPGPSASSVSQTPRGPVSGLWDVASRLVSLDERDPAGVRLTPLRWLQGKDVTFHLVDLKPGEPIDVAVTGASLAGGQPFSVVLMDEQGAVVTQIDRRGVGDRADEVFSSVVPASERMVLRVSSNGEPQWLAKLTSGQGSVAFEGAFEGDNVPPIRKYDGGAYAVVYRVRPEDVSVSSFTVTARQRSDGAFGVVVTRPDGTRTDLASDGVVPIDGQAGDYRIEVTFTKKADLGVAGPTTLLRFAGDQPQPALRPMWGRPSF